ncbi:DUF892 family protein [Sphingomonas sp.]|uniref:DUF892 family protein n=1 Tax=Sphingomonas sp. TaxID=28214 RepID=UPI002D8055FA|nr:DUF892 family protein [Sphingomonas sp.]HEU0043631.1 DUF892 family protein [Sphingomonas sp.]
MTQIGSAASLLHAAAQDLHDGKRQAAERLPGIAALASDMGLRAILLAEAERATEQAARLEATGLDTGGPENLWMSGILDDADRDGRSTQPGRLLDIALIGAVRKAKAAEIVSSETAVVLAAELADEPLSAAVQANYAQEIAADRALKARLTALTG